MAGGTQVELPDFEVDGPSPVFNLATTPFWHALAESISLTVRDTVLNAQAQSAVNGLADHISTSLSGLRAGYLARVNLYVTESGQLSIPGGALVTPIGLGLEPADALAEFYRIPSIGATVPDRYSDSSCYYWFTRRLDGNLDARLLPKQFRDRLERTAAGEARRRAALGRFYSAEPLAGFEIVQRAQYWSDIYTRYAANIADNRRRNEIEGLNAQMATLQESVNSVYKEYQKALIAMSNAQRSQAFLGHVATVISLLRTGIELGSVMSQDNMPVGQQGRPLQTNDDLMAYSHQRELEMNGVTIRTSVEIRGGIEAMRTLEQETVDRWLQSGIPVPKPEPIVLPEFP